MSDDDTHSSLLIPEMVNFFTPRNKPVIIESDSPPKSKKKKTQTSTNGLLLGRRKPEKIRNKNVNDDEESFTMGSEKKKKNKKLRMRMETNGDEITTPKNNEEKKKKNKKTLLNDTDQNLVADDSSPNIPDTVSPKKRKLKNLDSIAAILEDSEDSDDYERLPKRIKKEGSRPELTEEQKSRTVFFANVPRNWTKGKLVKTISKKYGPVEVYSVTYKPEKKTFKDTETVPEPKPEILNAVVRFVNKDSPLKAVKDNGSLFKDRHVRINMAYGNREYDRNKCVFVGNVPHGTEEDELWQIFSPCGDIENIRILRNRNTKICRGVAYVNFKNRDSVELAINLNGAELRTRELRVKRCVRNKEQKRLEKKQTKDKKKDQSNLSSKKEKKKNKDGISFQGQTVSSTKKQKKKKKLNKDEKRKRIIQLKLGTSVKAPKSIKAKIDKEA